MILDSISEKIVINNIDSIFIGIDDDIHITAGDNFSSNSLLLYSDYVHIRLVSPMKISNIKIVLLSKITV